jgi:NADH-quinone oxidoreductase subunit J
MFPELSVYLGPIYFYLFAAIALICAVLLLTSRHPITGAVNLIGVMLSLSGLYALLHSPFIAVLQVLVYAGAIMMLVVFVIMVLNQGKDDVVPRFDRMSSLGLLLPLLLGVALVRVAFSTPAAESADAVRGGVSEIATQMFTLGAPSQGWYLLFEIGGFLLLAAVVGAVLLAKRSLDSTNQDVNEGHAGRTAGAQPHVLADDEIAEHDDVAAAEPSGVHP